MFFSRPSTLRIIIKYANAIDFHRVRLNSFDTVTSCAVVANNIAGIRQKVSLKLSHRVQRLMTSWDKVYTIAAVIIFSTGMRGERKTLYTRTCISLRFHFFFKTRISRKQILNWCSFVSFGFLSRFCWVRVYLLYKSYTAIGRCPHRVFCQERERTNFDPQMTANLRRMTNDRRRWYPFNYWFLSHSRNGSSLVLSS